MVLSYRTAPLELPLARVSHKCNLLCAVECCVSMTMGVSLEGFHFSLHFVPDHIDTHSKSAKKWSYDMYVFCVCCVMI